jgi:hypothetical protein
MTTRRATALLLVSVVAATAHASVARAEAIVRLDPELPPEPASAPSPQWYGWRSWIPDLGALLIYAANQNGQPGLGGEVLSFAIVGFSGPLVHVAYRQPSKVVASLALRVVFPILVASMVSGAPLAFDSNGRFRSVAFDVGFVGALIDDFILSWETRPAAP